METRRLLSLSLLTFGILVGCSKKVEPRSDVSSFQPDDKLTAAERHAAEKTAAREPGDQPPPAEAKVAGLRTKPIATAKDELGELLGKWWKEGTAAGNVGDYYDNRDGDHSVLDTSVYPQLQRVVYSEEEIENRENWALMWAVRPHVTFGNASTAAPTELGGSNPRQAYCISLWIARLAQQYKSNNLYIYPECGDHRPGHNGLDGGYGDLYPTNTPYLLISQGFSWSDQPFMRAIPTTLAAFRPEVKKKLRDNGLLMPTVQMILRSTNKHLANPKEYLTGKAHPTVFEGSWVDALRMAQRAHEITVDTLPPLVRLKVLKEDAAVNRRDFFESPGDTEELASTPQVIARIWRGKLGQRRMTVSAADSYDLNEKPLTFTWVVLRGDEKQIRIKPRNKTGSEVEIVVPYHSRRMTANVGLESNRVDIGVFVHNGAYYSAPGFVTFYTLDNESRAYDEKGRVLEIGYGAADVNVRVSDYDVLLQALQQADGLPAKLFQLTDPQRVAFHDAMKRCHQCNAELTKRRSDLKAKGAKVEDYDLRRKKAEAERDRARKADAEKPSAESKAALTAAMKKAKEAATQLQEIEAEIEAAYKGLAEVEKQLDEIRSAKQPSLGDSISSFVSHKLRQLWQDPNLFAAHDKPLLAAIEKSTAPHRIAVEGARQRLIQCGLAKSREGGRLEWHPIRADSMKLEQRLTRFEKQLIEGFNAALLSELVLPGALSVSSSANFVDHHLFTLKFWRDVYHYDAKGKLTGWTRYDAKGVADFTEDGLIVLERDAVGRPIQVQTANYKVTESDVLGRPDKLECSAGEEIINYSYEAGERVEKSRLRAKEKK